MARRALRTVHVDTVAGWGGGQVQALMLARGLAERGHGAVLVCQPHSTLAERAAAAEIPVVPLRVRHSADPLALLALLRLFRRLAPDVVHLHTATAHTLGAPAARRARVPAVVASRRTAFPPNRSRLNRLRYTRWVDRVVAVSGGARDALLQAGVPAGQVTVIHSAVDCRECRPADRSRARLELGLPQRVPIVGAVGRLAPDKGHHLLLEAAGRISETYRDVLFLICGDGAQAAALRRQAHDAGLGDRVHFLGHLDDVRPVLAALDVFVLPSLQEGLGVALLEAMAMARPAVASRVGGIPDALEHDVTGLLAPPGDAQALADAILSLLANPDSRSRMAAAARARVMAHFTPEAMVAHTEALYFGLLERSGA